MTAIELKANDIEGPRLLIDVFNTALPTSGQPLAGDGISVTGSGQAKYVNVSFKSAISSLLSVTSVVGGVSDNSAALNGGVDIAANTLYQATLLLAPGETINFIYGANGGVYTLRVGEVVQQ
jgi:hypothetical protein